MKTRSIKINAILNSAKTVVGLLFPLITYPYVSRVLQVEGIGSYSFSASIVSYFVLIAGLGVSTYAIREGSSIREDQGRIEEFASEVFTINLLSSLISYILLFITVLALPMIGVYSTTILILSIEIASTAISVSWICNIFEDFLFIAVQTILSQVISLICIFLFVRNSTDVNTYAAILMASKAFVSIVNFVYIRIKYCAVRIVFRCNLRKHLKPMLVIFSASVAMTVYVNADITMLGFMTNDFEVGLYNTSVKIYTIVKSILASILAVLIPRFSILLQSGCREDANLLFSKVVNTLVALIIPAAAGLFMMSQDVIHLVAGESYIDGSLSLQILCIAISFSLIGTLYAQSVLIPMRRESKVFIVTVISAVGNLILNFLFIPVWGINGAAITTVIAEMTVCFLAVFYSKDTIKLGINLRDLSSVAIGCILIVAICFISQIVFDDYIIRLIFAMLISFFAYSFVLILLKNSSVEEFKTLFANSSSARE